MSQFCLLPSLHVLLGEEPPGYLGQSLAIEQVSQGSFSSQHVVVLVHTKMEHRIIAGFQSIPPQRAELLQKVIELVLVHLKEASVVVQVSLALRSMVLGQVEVGRFGRAGEGVRGESRSYWTDLDRVRRSRLKETSDTHIMTDSGQLSTTLQQYIR